MGMSTFALTGRRRHRKGRFGGLVLQVEEIVKQTNAGPGVTTNTIWRDAQIRDLTDGERAMLATRGG